MGIIDFSTRRPVTVIVFAMAAFVFGVVAFDDLPVELLPEISYPSLTVRTELEGAAPAEVESLVTKPVENAVGVVNNVVNVASSSRIDVSEVTLEFGWDTNLDMASLDVRDTNRLRRDGVEKLEALRRAGRARLRPILMTTSTTVLGLSPMALGLGEGGELRAPMALTVIGGLLTSTALTLLLVPAVYALLDRGHRRAEEDPSS